MDAGDIWSIMKWVLLVLFAGFIAQFGKVMAQSVLKKIGKEKSPAAVSPAGPPVNLSSSDRQMIVAPSDHSMTSDATERAPQMTTVVTDKKLIKALAKQKKKEAKNR